MKTQKIMAALAAAVLSIGLVACGPSVLTQEPLEEASGIKVTAENASKDQEVYSEDAITVKDGDVIIISPCMDKGAFHLTITASDGVTTVYDDDVSGRIMFQTGALPDTYDVKVSGRGATGWMTVFATSADEIAKQDVSLEEALIDAGVDPSILSGGE